MLLLDHIPLAETTNIKFLGVLIDKHLSFKMHVENLQASIRPYVGLIYRCSQFLPKQILLLIYNSYINSKINYCIESYGTTHKSTLTVIHILQKRIARIITNSPMLTHSDPLFKKLNILHVYKLFNLRTLIRSHTTFYSLSSSETTHLSHTHFTRASTKNLPLPSSTTSCGHRSPSYQAAELWNKLNPDLRSIQKSSEFRRRLKQHLLQ